MKLLKKILYCLLVICFLMLVFKGVLFRLTIKYQSIGTRTVVELSDPQAKARLNKLWEEQEATPEAVVVVARKFTNESLQFTFEKASSNPNMVYQERKANCIGYAALFCSSCSYLADHADIQMSTRHHIGKLSFLGIDIHQFTSHPFFKDHDFAEIGFDGTSILIDPSVSDVLGINEVR